ncbi:transposase [Tomitella fengzijianii]|uniref:Transposase n=1 Tax=Tomitella fengzijianii TaxID=2597660 RepID=A0A516X9Q1_9ACTN|nr:transposase [Tomitella fengzijianii]
MVRRHGVGPAAANEAVADPHAVWLTPDPASRTRQATRVIGYSRLAGSLVTVIVVDPAADPDEQPDGRWWGSNAWRSSRRDQRIYDEEA